MTDLNPVDAMTTDYRALCAELVDELEHTEDWPTRDALLARARALLAQPVEEGPTNKELLECAAKALGYGWISSYDTCQIVEAGDLVSFARAALAKWSHPTPPPQAAELEGAGVKSIGICSWTRLSQGNDSA